MAVASEVCCSDVKVASLAHICMAAQAKAGFEGQSTVPPMAPSHLAQAFLASQSMTCGIRDSRAARRKIAANGNAVANPAKSATAATPPARASDSFFMLPILARASAFDHWRGKLQRHEDCRLELQHGTRPQGRGAARSGPGHRHRLRMCRAGAPAVALPVLLDAGRSRLDWPQPAQGPRGLRLQRLRRAARGVLSSPASLSRADPWRRPPPRDTT